MDVVPVQTPAGFEPAFDLAVYYPVLIYFAVVCAFAVGVVVASRLKHTLGLLKSTPVKLMTYESGMDPIGDAKKQFDVKFYLIAILFLVFDVELLFLYPWATIAHKPGPGVTDVWWLHFHRLVFWEILIFIASLAIAYIYAWRRGVFAWRR